MPTCHQAHAGLRQHLAVPLASSTAAHPSLAADALCAAAACRLTRMQSQRLALLLLQLVGWARQGRAHAAAQQLRTRLPRFAARHGGKVGCHCHTCAHSRREA